jgi:hypothetical protein
MQIINKPQAIIPTSVFDLECLTLLTVKSDKPDGMFWKLLPLLAKQLQFVISLSATEVDGDLPVCMVYKSEYNDDLFILVTVNAIMDWVALKRTIKQLTPTTKTLVTNFESLLFNTFNIKL